MVLDTKNLMSYYLDSLQDRPLDDLKDIVNI